MSDVAAHLVDRVLAEVPIRQWCSRCRTALGGLSIFADVEGDRGAPARLCGSCG